MTSGMSSDFPGSASAVDRMSDFHAAHRSAGSAAFIRPGITYTRTRRIAAVCFPTRGPGAAPASAPDRRSERCPPSRRRKPLAAAAMVTSRVGLATLVASPEGGARSVSVPAQAPELAVTAAPTPRSQQVPVSRSPV